MFRESELGRIKPSIAELKVRQRWRNTLLWVVRTLMLLSAGLLLYTVLQWPFDDFAVAVDRCMRGAPQLARDCAVREAEERRIVAGEARLQVFAFLGLLAMTILLAFRVRFGLRRQLRENIRFSDQVFNSVPLPLTLRTPGGIFLKVNAEFEKRYGVAQEDVQGRRVSDLPLPAAIAQEVERLDMLAIGSPGPIETELVVTRDGRTDYFILRLQAMRDADGAAVGIVTVREDVTALRVHEAELTLANEKLRQLSAQMIDAQEDERRRIARDLHDQVGQVLTALKMQLGMVSKQGTVPDAGAALLLAREFADEALRHTRDLSASLHPHLLDDLGLEAALGWLVDRFVRPLVPTVDLRCRLAPARTSQDIELVAFRVVQEALTNAARHAQATRIGVILEATGDSLTIEVIDDGVGFEGGAAGIDARRGTSLGLAGMNDRVAELGGVLALDSTPGVGTRLRATLPWAKERVDA
ncbi:MAG TPA: ATP-binding protein [Ramlibacter sp.]|jgi:PAS domain S-box-containing protein